MNLSHFKQSFKNIKMSAKINVFSLFPIYLYGSISAIWPKVWSDLTQEQEKLWVWPNVSLEASSTDIKDLAGFSTQFWGFQLSFFAQHFCYHRKKAEIVEPDK